MSTVAERWAQVEQRVADAAGKSGRSPGDVSVIAVSKKQPVAVVQGAIDIGLRDFGENYAQELADKRGELAHRELRWHFIGQLQRNKVKLVLGAYLIHAVDSTRLADAISRRAAQEGSVQDVLIAVNLGDEAQKSGVPESQVEALVEHCAGLEGLRCRGLMTMPPWPKEPEDSRPYFHRLRALRERLDPQSTSLPHLSMGTSGDFEVAVEEGATLVRVGTALLGPRPVENPG